MITKKLTPAGWEITETIEQEETEHADERSVGQSIGSSAGFTLDHGRSGTLTSGPGAGSGKPGDAGSRDSGKPGKRGTRHT